MPGLGVCVCEYACARVRVCLYIIFEGGGGAWVWGIMCKGDEP